MRNGQVLALDIGGTKIAVGLVKNGEVIGKFKIPTDAAKGRRGVERGIEEALARGLELGKNVTKVGIGIAGNADAARGVFLGGPNLPKSFANVDFKKTYGKKHGIDVRIDNDVHCYALGEAAVGAGKGASTMVGIAVGTGIGGGIVMNGKLFRGAHNLAGEIGHMTVGFRDERPCGCGGVGHFEAYASGSGIEREYERRTSSRLRAKDIALLADSDRHAADVYREAHVALAAGITGVIHAFDPDVVVLGGGLSKEPLLWNGLKTAVAKNLAYGALKRTRIVRSKLRSDANLLGAAALHLV